MNEHACKGISVIVAAHGRASLLGRLLASLKVSRDSVPVPTEVLVVDSSPQKEAEVIVAFCLESDASYLRHDLNNVRQKRNAGVTAAVYDVVLFIDSDCEATPELLQEHASPYAAGGEIGGVAGVTEFVGKDSFIWRVISTSTLLDAFSYAKRMEYVPWGPTCNISYRRDLIVRLGTFDASFPFRLGADDVDLGLRVTDAGFKIKGNSRAVTFHARETWDGVSLLLRRVFRWGRMHFHLMVKHPRRVFLDFPTVTVQLLALSLICIAVAFVTGKAVYATLPPLWLMTELFVETVLVGMLLGRLREFGLLVAARLVRQVYETGLFLEALKRHRIFPFYSEISYTPPSLHGRNFRVLQLWACVAAYLTVLLVASK